MDLQQIEAQAVEIGKNLIADRAKVDLYYLCKYILGYGEIMDPKVHGPLCRYVRTLLFYNRPDEEIPEFPSDYGREDGEGMPTEEEKQAFWEDQERFEPDREDVHSVKDKLERELTNLLCLMPRGTLKSSVVTIGFPIQWHLNFPDDRILLDSETFSKATAFLTEMRGHYEDNDKLRDVFFTIHDCYPDENARKDTWADRAINLACRGRKRKEESVSCAGIDVTKNGMHYDLVIMDDLHSDKNTKNTEQLNQVKEHYRLVYSLLDPGKPAIVIGTRWDYNDLYQEIIDTEQDDFNFITRKAEDDDGEEFYPSRLPRKELDRLRKKQGDYMYSCQYLNNPVDDESATFKRSMFRYISLQEAIKNPINWYGLVDPSYEGDSSDYAAIVVAGMDWQGEIYVRHIFREKMNYSQIAKKIFELDQLFNLRQWGIETISAQKSIMHFIDQEQKRRNRFLRIHQFKHRPRTKEERIRALEPYYEFGRVHHINNVKNIDKLEYELLKFPRAKNDDISDCLAGILEIGKPPSHRVESEEEKEKRKEKLKKLNKPRSPMIGY